MLQCETDLHRLLTSNTIKNLHLLHFHIWFLEMETGRWWFHRNHPPGGCFTFLLTPPSSSFTCRPLPSCFCRHNLNVKPKCCEKVRRRTAKGCRLESVLQQVGFLSSPGGSVSEKWPARTFKTAVQDRGPQVFPRAAVKVQILQMCDNRQCLAFSAVCFFGLIYFLVAGHSLWLTSRQTQKRLLLYTVLFMYIIHVTLAGDLEWRTAITAGIKLIASWSLCWW